MAAAHDGYQNPASTLPLDPHQYGDPGGTQHPVGCWCTHPTACETYESLDASAPQMQKGAEHQRQNPGAGSHARTRPPPRTAAVHQERASGMNISWEGAGDVPLVIKPIQPFRVLRVSLRGCGRLIPRSAASGCSGTSP
ncbi:hypothetical protein PIB30_100815 [Stylosanthes scabra]|uniref:Uncharacterized protein n=1 Tax=Stylosanthes scabra TaxID=79078 RepID=A0ABU6WVI0_9FABA|nr:hypothetical protein [Stylosanthes scabra]